MNSRPTPCLLAWCRAIPLAAFLASAASPAHTAPADSAKPWVALATSVIATTVPIGVGVLLGTLGENQDIEALTTLAAISAVGGLLVGPSAGQFYLGSKGHAYGALAVRTAGAALFAVGLIKARTTNRCGEDEEDCHMAYPGSGWMIAGGLVMGGGGLYSLVQPWITAGRTTAPDPTFSFAPTLAPAPGSGATRVGARARLCF